MNTDLFVNGTLRKQLVMYELNEEGEIRSLYTAKDYANTNLLDSENRATEYENPTYNEEGYKGYDEENFSLDFVDKTLFRTGFNHLYQFNDETIAFIVPKDPNQTQKYKIISGNAKVHLHTIYHIR